VAGPVHAAPQTAEHAHSGLVVGPVSVWVGIFRLKSPATQPDVPRGADVHCSFMELAVAELCLMQGLQAPQGSERDSRCLLGSERGDRE